MDTQTEELRAMFASFLGENYSQERIDRVEALQTRLRVAHADLVQRLELGQIEPAAYAARFNELLAACFSETEEVLGHDDFAALFGGPSQEQSGFIDTQAFLRSYHRPQLAR